METCHSIVVLHIKLDRIDPGNLMRSCIDEETDGLRICIRVELIDLLACMQTAIEFVMTRELDAVLHGLPPDFGPALRHAFNLLVGDWFDKPISSARHDDEG